MQSQRSESTAKARASQSRFEKRFSISAESERKTQRRANKEIKDLAYQKLCEFLKCNEFNATYDIVKELEFAYSKAFKQLYEYKIKEMEETNDQADDIEREYRLGIIDPARTVAKIEKQVAIKKNVGMKKKILDNMKKFQDRKNK